MFTHLWYPPTYFISYPIFADCRILTPLQNHSDTLSLAAAPSARLLLCFALCPALGLWLIIVVIGLLGLLGLLDTITDRCGTEFEVCDGPLDSLVRVIGKSISLNP